MAVISAKDHLKTHNQLMEEFREHVKRVDAKQPPPRDLATGVKERTIEALRATLSGAEEARKETVKRFDAKISKLSGEISRLEKEVTEERKQQAGGGKKRSPKPKRDPVRPTSKGRAKGGAAPAGSSIPLEKIKGIGPTRAKALRNAGVVDVAAFRKTPTEKLRKILGPLDYQELKTRSVALMKTAKKTGSGSK
jgi:predicted flap endonuclease-1-like 5' DNA nuclease